MYNLYQSHTRQAIQEIIYKKPSFTIKLFGRDYFGTIKTKNIGPFKYQRYQVLGVTLPNDEKIIKKEIEHLKKQFHNKKGNIFFQLGITNEIVSFDNRNLKCEEFKQDLREMRIGIRNMIQEEYQLNNSFRENMPQSGIIYLVNKTDEQLLSETNSGCKDRIKKAIKNELQFGIAKHDEEEIFYQKRKELAGKKGFNIIPHKQYKELVKYIRQNKCGELFIAKKDENIVAGSICLFDQDRVIYLYGFSDRNYSKIGGHHFLKFRIFTWARDNGYSICDMIGGAPTGFPEHPLQSISEFKESMGGTKIEYYGNFDIILNPLLYKAFKRYYQWKH